jgi:hypothetical protein
MIDKLTATDPKQGYGSCGSGTLLAPCQVKVPTAWRSSSLNFFVYRLKEPDPKNYGSKTLRIRIRNNATHLVCVRHYDAVVLGAHVALYSLPIGGPSVVDVTPGRIPAHK